MFLPRNTNVFLVLGKTHHRMSCTLFFFYSRTSKCLWFRKKGSEKSGFVIIPRSAKPACLGHFLCIPWVTDPVVVLCGIVACFSPEGKDIWSLSADTKQHLKRSGRGILQMHVFTTRIGGRGAEITKSEILKSALNDRNSYVFFLQFCFHPLHNFQTHKTSRIYASGA